MAGDILVLAEKKNEELDSVTFELLTKGRMTADKSGANLAVLLVGHNLTPLTEVLADSGADSVLVADDPLLENNNLELYSKVISDAVQDFKPSLFFLGYTYFGIAAGPVVATRLEVPMVSSCVDLELVDEKVIVTRPMFNGIFHTKLEIQGVTPHIISFQKGVLPKEKLSPKTASVSRVPVTIEESAVKTRVLGWLEAPPGEIDLTKVELIVAVGRGIKDKANIRLAQELADTLDGVVGCSRPLADLGWLPDEVHVGMSGKTVAPKVYIACGISGATQHVAGMRDTNLIIGINNDPNAPIFQVAHYGVVADLFEIIPALTTEACKSS